MDSTKIIFILLVIGSTLCLTNTDAASAGLRKCVEQPRDLFLVVDDSASIGRKSFEKIRNFLTKLVSQVNIARHMTRIGLLQFSDETNTKIRFNLDNNLTSQETIRKFENLTWLGGKMTLTHLALKMVADQVYTKTRGDRPNVPDIAVVFTDGKSHYPRKTKKQAQRLKNMGVRMIAIGAGRNLKTVQKKLREELLNIASSPDDMMMVDFANLEDIVSDIVSRVCRVITTVAPTTTTPPKGLYDPHILNKCIENEGKDILFLVDGTVNERMHHKWSQKEFKKVKRFIKSFVRGLNDARFRVGVMQYSHVNTAKMNIDFMSPLNKREFKLRLATMIQQGGYERYTGDALVHANKKFYDFDSMKRREKSPNIIILITRGIAKDKQQSISEAGMLDSRKIRLISVGVHSSVSAPYLSDYLHKLVSKEFLFIFRYNTLKKNRASILNAMCMKVEYAPRPGLPAESAKCSRGPQDLFFVIDGSASINYFNFEKVQIFLMDLVSLLVTESSQINTGLMQFSQKEVTNVVWNLGRYSEYETIMKIRNMKYQAGTKTYTGDALARVNEEVFTKTLGDRPNVPDILILFTDGNAHDKKLAQTQADFLKKKGVLVITIGAGSESSLRIFRQDLTKMSSGPEYSLLVDFENIQYFAEKVFPIVCDYMKKKKL